MMNKSFFVGRLTTDHELKKANDKSVCTVSIAVEDGYGEKKKVSYPSIVIWGKTAEYVCKYARKGSMMIVLCRYYERTYQNKEGRNVKVHEFMAEKIILPEPKKQETTQGYTPSEDAFPTEQDYQFPYDDDLPF